MQNTVCFLQIGFDHVGAVLVWVIRQDRHMNGTSASVYRLYLYDVLASVKAALSEKLVLARFASRYSADWRKHRNRHWRCDVAEISAATSQRQRRQLFLRRKVARLFVAPTISSSRQLE